MLSLRWRPGVLAKRGLTLLGWMLLRASIQTATVVWLARQLGVLPYGQFVAMIAASSFLTPFVGLGLSHILLRNAARDPAHAGNYLGRAMHWWIRTLLPCVAASVVLAMWLLPERIAWPVLFTVAAAELSATSLTELYGRYLQARQRTHMFGVVNAGLPAVRLLALGLLWAGVENAGINIVLLTYAAGNLIYAALLWLPMHLAAKEPNSALPEPMTMRNGLPFSLAVFATKLQGELNKPILAQTDFSLAGSYSVAQRSVDIVTLPLIALQEALWPRLYAHANPIKQLRETGAKLLMLAMLLGISLWVLAPNLPLVFGIDFEESVDVLRFLSLLPALQMLRALLNFNAIYHIQSRKIALTYSFGGVVSVASLIMLAPAYGMKGAAGACYATELAMILILCLRIKNKAL